MCKLSSGTGLTELKKTDKVPGLTYFTYPVWEMGDESGVGVSK